MTRRRPAGARGPLVVVLCHALLTSRFSYASPGPAPNPKAGAAAIHREAKGPESASVEPRRETPEERLSRGAEAYERSDFPSTIQAVRGLLYPEIELHSESDVIAAHRLLALAYLFSGQEGSAEGEFSALLLLRPDFSLDPVGDPRSALAFLERVKERQRDRLYEIELRRRSEAERAARDEERHHKEEEERARRVLKSLEHTVVIERHNFMLSFVPFGVGQFQNGQRKKGWALLATELAVGGTSLALWVSLQIRYSGGATPVPQADQPAANAMSASTIALGAVFWAEVIYGVIDAIVYYKPQAVVSPAGGAPSPSSVGSSSIGSSSVGAADIRSALSAIRLSPSVVPGGGGLSLSGVF